MAQTLDEIGIAAVDRFITTWNSRDAVQWADSLNFPHVRPGPFGTIAVAKDAAEYISRVDFNRTIETGWDHSEWDYKHVLHTSPRKIHVVGQWSRYNAAGEKILTNPVVYIVTRVEGKWGVQSRFSADYAGDDDTSGMEGRAFKLMELLAIHTANRLRDACASLLNYPHFDVGVGNINITPLVEDYQLPDGSFEIDSMISLQTGRRSINLGVDLTLTTESGRRPLQAVVNVTDRDGHLGISAWSLLDPNEIDDA